MTEKAKVGQHLSVCDLADILKLITDKPMTGKQVAEVHKCGLVVLRRILRGMVQLGVAHVHGWETSIRGTPAAIFAGGGGVNASPLKTRDGRETRTPWGKGVRSRPSVNLILFASLIRALEHGATIAELRDATGANPATATRFANHCKAIGLAHVGAWDQKNAGYPARVFMLGSRRSVPRPKAMSPIEKALRNYHAKKSKLQQQAITAAITRSWPEMLEAA